MNVSSHLFRYNLLECYKTGTQNPKSKYIIFEFNIQRWISENNKDNFGNKIWLFIAYHDFIIESILKLH